MGEKGGRRKEEGKEKGKIIHAQVTCVEGVKMCNIHMQLATVYQ